MEKENKSFPNIPVSHWKTLRGQFKKSIPGTITSNYLSSILGMSEVSAKTNIMAPLRVMGFIDENGSVNQDMARKYRDDNQYKDFCADLLKKIYPSDLLDAFPDVDSDREKVKSWFMNHTGGGESGVGRMVAFYLTLCEADTSTAIDSGKKPKASNNSIVKPKASLNSTNKTQPTLNAKIETKSEEKPSIQPVSKKTDLPSLNINIQVHISSDATPDQIDKIFESMGKHLFNK